MIFRQTSERLLLWASLGIALLLALTVPVFSQEAYYWCYAEHPALSYYDHPPMVAWLIGLGTSAFGDGALGIRVFTVACGLGVTLAGLGLLRAFQATQQARNLWIVIGFGAPMYAVLHVLANPDAPLCLFWALTMLCLWHARNGGVAWWLAAGMAAGASLLSKYNAAFLAVGGGIVLAADPAMRRQWRSPGPWLGVLTAVAVFLPVLLWNVGNDFASFHFQTDDRYAKASLGLRWFTQCALGQFAVMNPGLVILLPFAVRWLVQQVRSGDARATWLLAFGLPMPLFWLGNSLFLQVKINWFLPAYLPLYLGVALWWSEGRGAQLHPRFCSIAKWSLVVALALPLAPLMRLLPQRRGSSWHGWDQIAAAAQHDLEIADAFDGKSNNMFFFGSDYKDCAQLQRALKLLPGKPQLAPVLAQNVFGRRALQFDHWDSPINHLGEDAIYVLARPDARPNELLQCRAHFRSVERRHRVQVTCMDLDVLAADVFFCHDYLGPHPSDKSH